MKLIMNLEPLSEQARKLKLGVYDHYKGNRYRVLGVGRHSETVEEFVVYQGLYGDNLIWVRPITSFLDTVEVDENIIPRFNYVEE